MLVLGIPVVIYGTITPSSFQIVDLVMLIASAFMLWLFAETKKTITRWQGWVMLLAFAVYYVLVFVI